MKDYTQPPDAGADGIIEGRNAVAEALRSGTPIDKLYIARGETDRTLARIAAQAKKAGVVVVEADRRKLDAMSATGSHQGVIASAAVRAYASVEDIFRAAGFVLGTISRHCSTWSCMPYFPFTHSPSSSSSTASVMGIS